MCARSLLLCILGIIAVINGKSVTTLTVFPKVHPFARTASHSAREGGNILWREEKLFLCSLHFPPRGLLEFVLAQSIDDC